MAACSHSIYVAPVGFLIAFSCLYISQGHNIPPVLHHISFCNALFLTKVEIIEKCPKYFFSVFGILGYESSDSVKDSLLGYKAV
jgi:hypothetical protein